LLALTLAAGCAAEPVASPKAATPPPPPLTPAQTATPPLSAAESRAETLLSRMTLEEKLAYVGGDRDFYIRGIERLGLPPIKLADGPLGCRNWGPSTAYPATVGLAASFDGALATRVGSSIGRDCRARGVHMLLAPGVNLQRSPLSGRNFEYMGEDPLLAGSLATQYVKGVQGEGVLATVKHFAANNQEWDRNHVSSEVDERTLRELYFPAFEQVVKEGKVAAVMSSYNLLNGIYASHNPWLLKTVLRQQWGFSGIVVSDWVAIHDPVGGALGGCDLEMPSAAQMSPANLRQLLESGTMSEAQLDDKVRHILRTIVAAGFLDREQTRKDIPLDDPTSRATALQAARESLVLLKNEGGLLPLDASKLRTLAVVGPNATPEVHGGAGSSWVTPLHQISVKEALEAAAPGAKVLYHPGIRQRTTYGAMGAAVFSGPVKEELFEGQALEGKPVAVREVERIDFDPDDGVSPAPGLVGHEHYSVRWTGTVELAKAGSYDVMANADDGIRVLLDGKKVLDDWSDHAPRTTLKTLQLKAGKHQVVVEYYQGILGAIAQFGLGPTLTGESSYGAKELDAVLSQADVTVVCLGFGQSADTNSMSRQFNAFWPPGWAREANLIESEDSDRGFALPEPQLETLRHALAKGKRVIALVNAGGGVDLSGFKDVPALLWAWYPGQEGGTAIAEVLFGTQTPSGKLPITLARRLEDHPAMAYYNLNEGGKTPYREGLKVGYRGFDALGIDPLYPFGYGLSYTTFAYSEAAASPRPDGSVEVAVTIANTGSRPGAEVVQLYVAPPADTNTPPQSLAAFARVQLDPGTKQRVTLTVPARAFAHWEDGWRIAAGTYQLHVSASSRDHRATLPVTKAAATLGL